MSAAAASFDSSAVVEENPSETESDRKEIERRTK